MIKRIAQLPAVFLLALLAGCAAQRPQDTRPMAECPVCRENADLACLNVRVDDQTPHAEYRGVTYYFCSEDCRKDFVKNPAKYVR
jgi:YHS domain-containing protein